MKQIDKESLQTSAKIAFVTGYVGLKGTAKIPKKPLGYNGYYITNNEKIFQKLKRTKWIPVFIDDILELFSGLSSNTIFKKYSKQDIATFNENESIHFFTMACKALKLRPQQFVSQNYDFLVWYDNKFDVNVADSIKVINQWNDNKAIMLHIHPSIKNIEDEFAESMMQHRYLVEKEKYQSYIDSNIKKGLTSQNKRHYQCGYIIYNMTHAKTLEIQDTWQKHIGQCGLNDQISFNFVAQLFDEYLDVFEFDIGIKIRSFFNKLERRLKGRK